LLINTAARRTCAPVKFSSHAITIDTAHVGEDTPENETQRCRPRAAFAFRQGFYLTISDGVAVAIRGAPLMRLFKAIAPRSAEDEAAAVRLMTIECRFKPNRSVEVTDKQLPGDPESSEDPDTFQ
jgi:hypothetical protein